MKGRAVIYIWVLSVEVSGVDENMERQCKLRKREGIWKKFHCTLWADQQNINPKPQGTNCPRENVERDHVSTELKINLVYQDYCPVLNSLSFIRNKWNIQEP